ncbi:MAG: hypothetical protein H6719_15975 [Sandaracinaceae bacterium]|nr:hypothetical protein [Sandaracinaceae bacterium]
MRPFAPRHNIYANLQALLDTTRPLNQEEMAELQLELGYVDRALAIYEELLRADPSNPWVRGRCEWLARLAMAQVRTIRSVGAPAPEVRSRSITRPGWSEPPPQPRAPASIRPLRIVPVG